MMIANQPANAAKQQQPTIDLRPDQDFEANLLKTLEISAYDLVALKSYLTGAQFIPTSSDEDGVDNAVFLFRRRFSSASYLFPANERLNKLFEAWNDEHVEFWVKEHGERNAQARYELQLQRETAKYNAVRALIAYLAARQKIERR